jgi:hypothetical protein
LIILIFDIYFDYIYFSYRSGEPRNYNGGRTTESIVKYGQEMTGPSIQILKNNKKWNTIIKNEPVIVTLFSEKNNEAVKIFKSLAYRLQGLLKFVHVLPPSDKIDTLSIYEQQSIDSNTIPMLQIVTIGGDNETYSGPWNEQDVREFIDLHRLPLVSRLEAHNFDVNISILKIL